MDLPVAVGGRAMGKMPEPSPTERRQTGTKTLHKLRLIETTENLPINVQPYVLIQCLVNETSHKNPLLPSYLPLLTRAHILLSLVFQFRQPILVSNLT